MIEIRREEPSDQGAIRHLNELAFECKEEANVVDKLRTSCDDYLSFVAIDQGDVVGHILFTPVTIDGSKLVGMGLAPMSVSPPHQRKGIGSRLVRHGLDHLRQSRCSFVIVLGHPEYYPRFGFDLASRYALRSQWDGVPDEAFMALVLDEAVLPELRGTARYRAEFDEAM
jgi:putative acetyltransferase